MGRVDRPLRLAFSRLLMPLPWHWRRGLSRIDYDVTMTNDLTANLPVDGRPLRSGFLWVPHRTWVERDRLYWTLHDSDRTLRAKQKRYTAGMFQTFIELDGKDAEAYCAYASRWGVFRLCKHDLPHMHNWPTGTNKWGCRPRGTTLRQWEPLGLWRKVVAQFRACLAITAAIQMEKKGSADAWRALGHDAPPSQLSKRTTMLRSTINGVLYLGGVHPGLEYVDGSFRTMFQTAGGNLFGALALQLLLAVSRTDGLAHCSACGNPFVFTGRRPNPNRRCYCPSCGLPAAQRDASRAYRARLRQSRQPTH